MDYTHFGESSPHKSDWSGSKFIFLLAIFANFPRVSVNFGHLILKCTVCSIVMHRMYYSNVLYILF